MTRFAWLGLYLLAFSVNQQCLGNEPPFRTLASDHLDHVGPRMQATARTAFSLWQEYPDEAQAIDLYENQSIKRGDTSSIDRCDGLGDDRGVLCDSGFSENGFCDSGSVNSGSFRSARCPTPWWAHRTSLIGEYFLLAPSNSDYAYAIQRSSDQADAYTTGQSASVGVLASSGYRFGFSWANTHNTSLVATYTHWEGNDEDQIEAAPNNVLISRSLQANPNIAGNGTTSIASTLSGASMSMGFTFADIVYRHHLFNTDSTYFNWSAGFRYARMKNRFHEYQLASPAQGLSSLDSTLRFEGAGLLMGIDAQRRSSRSGMLCFTRGLASFLGGQWNGSLTETNTNASSGVIESPYEDYRVTPVLEAELGVGWQSKSGRFRATVGYMTSCWFNALNSRTFSAAMRRDDYAGANEAIPFIGMTARVETRF